MTQSAKVSDIIDAHKKIKKKQDTPSKMIDSRKTDELIIALCGAVGSGVSTVSDKIKKVLEDLGYETVSIKLSDHISSLSSDIKNVNQYERIKSLQIEGNKLRESFENDILSQLAIRDICKNRIKKLDPDGVGEKDYSTILRKRIRIATIIDSLKNPDEADLLYKVYGNMFYLFGILCNDEVRKERLKDMQMSETEAVELMQRDKKDKDNHGQQLLKTLQHADFFVRNNKSNTASLESPIRRFVNLILGQNNITPTINEFGMYMAESSARMSGCISRQVGAAILTEAGDIVAIGRNDVPKPLGGLYREDDGDDDCRCFKQHDHSCANQKNKNLIFRNIERAIREKIQTLPGETGGYEKAIGAFLDDLKEDSEIKDLIEYSRAVHAEMDAITSAARNGGHSLKGTILFSTTFPCHHCARHIVAAGIKEVFYIEPYEKSLALKLHSDAIALDNQCDGIQSKKVVFSHFEGVAPKQYLHLFSCNNRKKDGRLIDIDLRNQAPTRHSLLDTFIEYESKVVDYVNGRINHAHGESDE